MIALRGLHPEIRRGAEEALRWAEAYQIPVTVTSGHRTWAEQQWLRTRYERCLARGERIAPSNPNAACRYPANQPGDSAHNWRLAWDSWVPAPYVEAWKAIRRWVGFTVPDGDVVHAELPEWRAYTAYLPMERG